MACINFYFCISYREAIWLTHKEKSINPICKYILTSFRECLKRKVNLDEFTEWFMDSVVVGQQQKQRSCGIETSLITCCLGSGCHLKCLSHLTCANLQIVVLFSARRAAKEAKEAPAQPAPVSYFCLIFLFHTCSLGKLLDLLFENQFFDGQTVTALTVICVLDVSRKSQGYLLKSLSRSVVLVTKV